jgi:hypothetical protein
MRRAICWTIVIITVALALSAFGVDCAAKNEAEKWPTYHGAWFIISYPPGFKVRPSLNSSSSDARFDSVFFAPKDKSVEFYVFSPQWNGDPADIALQPKTERIISTKSVQKRLDQIETITIKWTTIAAKDGSYSRSIVDTESSLNTRTVFAIKYRDSKTLQKYKADFARFKKSLVQFAD